MPELPEVETVRRGLNQTTLRQEIGGGDVLLERTIAHPLSMVEFLSGLRGAMIADWHRRGKYLLAELIQVDSTFDSTFDSISPPQTAQAAGWLGVHLRMTGQLLWVSQSDPLQKHCRVRLFFPEQKELRFVDQRTFGQMWYVPPGLPPEEIISGLGKLGPEPLSDDFSVDYFTAHLCRRQRPVKNALLDQELVAGIGNIYADEALFLSRIKPTTLCSKLSAKQVQRLQGAIIQVLQDSINARGTSFSNYRDVEGINGNYGGLAWVYNREGQPCRVCSTPIQRLKLAGRSTHFCPKCQRSR